MTDQEYNDLVDKIGAIVWRQTLPQTRTDNVEQGLTCGRPPSPNPVTVWDGLCRAGIIRPEHSKFEILGIVTAVYRHLKLPCPRDALVAFYDIGSGRD